MEWCHEIPFINAVMIYWRRSCVIMKIFQHRYFVSMCLTDLTHVPHDVSAIAKDFIWYNTEKVGKWYFLTSMFFCSELCYEM